MCKFNKLLAYRLSHNIYIGESPYGLFNQEEIITELQKCGVRVIISLLEDNEIYYDISEYSKKFHCVVLPTLREEIPSAENIEHIFSLASNNEIIYLHSMDGAERASVVTATYLHRVYGLKGEDLLLKLRDIMDGKIGLRWGRMSQKQREYILNLNEGVKHG